MLRGFQRGPRRAAARRPGRGGGVLAQRRHRRLARVPRPPCGAGRGRLQPLRHVRPSRGLPGARAGARRLDGGCMEWMSPVDSSFLHVENDTTPMHIGAVSIFEGPPPPFDDLRAMVAGKLGLVPRYRQKVRFVPLAAGRPCGSTIRTSASTTTCATPPSPRPAARSSCARWPPACSHRRSTATSRCGSCGPSRA